MNIFGDLTPYAGKDKSSHPFAGDRLDSGIARDIAIRSLWTLHVDTFDIAKKLHLPQALVANRLAVMRDAAA